jgi:hypothetical protein
MPNPSLYSLQIRNWLDRIGDWNPQLLREIRGKLKLRNLIVAIGVSLLFQALLILFYSQRLPTDNCYVRMRGFGCVVSWTEWWLEQFRFITWSEPFVLFFVGVYSLIADLSSEDNKGTLNFIRLTPRSSINILLGKIMGVPLLGYIAIAMVIPYHLTAAIAAGVPIAFLLSFYVVLIGTAFLLFSTSLLLALLSGWQAKIGGQVSAGALVFSFLTFAWFSPAFMWWNISTTWSIFSKFLVGKQIDSIQAEWWYLSITSNIFTSHLFTIANLVILSLVVWRILQRRFHNPMATIVSKGQSYTINAYCQTLMLGFCLQSSFTTSRIGDSPELQLILLLIIYIANFFLFLTAIAALTPQRQSILDWVRFGALSSTEEHPVGFKYMLRELIWADKSPAPIAIMLNLLFTQVPILIWVNSWANLENRHKAFIVLTSFALTMVLFAIVSQLVLLLRTRNPAAWVTGIISALILLPVVIMLSLSISPERYAGLWLFFGFPWVVLSNINLNNIILAFIAQSSLIIGLALQLIYQLQQARMQKN